MVTGVQTIHRQIRSSCLLRGLFFLLKPEGPFLFDVAFFIYNMILFLTLFQDNRGKYPSESATRDRRER